jgi:hypothetical protein
LGNVVKFSSSRGKRRKDAPTKQPPLAGAVFFGDYPSDFGFKNKLLTIV